LCVAFFVSPVELMNGGSTDKAIELYRKCEEVDPSMKNFVNRRIEALTKAGE
jgi:hypothetical protein